MRFNKKSRERLLYVATGLLAFVILSVTIWVIPHAIKDMTPEKSIEMTLPVYWVIVVMHLIIMVILIGEIRISSRGGQLRKTWLIIPGIILILMSMLLFDAAGAYLKYQPDTFGAAIILFFNAFCDIMAGIITVMLPTRFPD